MAFQDELKLYFDARIAVVNVVTSEEARILQEITTLAPFLYPEIPIYYGEVISRG